MSPILETQRLKVVKMTPNDIDLLYQVSGDEEVTEFFPRVLNREETRQMLDKILDHYGRYGHCFWKVLLEKSGDFVGIAGLLDGEKETEIAYRIKREYWNKGYATEAAQGCKEYGQRVLGKKRLISMVHPKNHASKRVAEKLGARKAKSIIFDGKGHDLYVY